MDNPLDGNGQEPEYIPLFDGVWPAGDPRPYGSLYPRGPSVLGIFAEAGRDIPVEPEEHAAHRFVEDGALIGEQDSPGSGYGGYLISDKAYGDFELVLEMRPDWPADTGVMIRRQRHSWEGFQVLVDHRPSGGIGGFFGNRLASFSAVPFAIDVVRDADGRPVGLKADDPATSVEPVTEEKRARLSYAWRWDDWNELRISAESGEAL